jgi:hypothetical protein
VDYSGSEPRFEVFPSVNNSSPQLAVDRAIPGQAQFRKGTNGQAEEFCCRFGGQCESVVDRHCSLTTYQPDNPAMVVYEQDGCCARTFPCNTVTGIRGEQLLMVKTEDLPLLEIARSRKGLSISLKEDEVSADEWNHIRTSAFTRLRNFGSIPHELLDLVEHFKERTAVQLVGRKISDDELRLGIKVLNDKTKNKKRNLMRGLAELFTAHNRIMSEDKQTEMTASDALAFYLSMSLRELKHAERTRKGAPVRTLKLIPRSLIAEIATDLISSCQIWHYAPGQHLVLLLRELLNVEGDKQGLSRRFDARERTISIVAQAPEISTRELAKLVHVDASTISRWRRSEDFAKEVASWQERCKEVQRLKVSGHLAKIFPGTQAEHTSTESARPVPHRKNFIDETVIRRRKGRGEKKA